MNAADFNTYWNMHFPAYPPVGYLLRAAYPDRWFRIHTLPEAKRYPETAAEYAEILRRHNTIFADLFSNLQTLALLTTGYSATPRPVPPDKIDKRYHPFVLLRSIPMHEADEDKAFHRYWHIWLHFHSWQPQSLDLLLGGVADNTIANVLIVDAQKDVLYHPYDGGADVIVETQAERDRWRTSYRAWLPQHPPGL
jgi:hypothetical protein